MPGSVLPSWRNIAITLTIRVLSDNALFSATSGKQ